MRLVRPTKSTLYVTGAKTCPPAWLAAPAPATTPGDASHVAQGWESTDVTVVATFRGSRCSARLTAWLDSDGDGKPSLGDFVGSTPEIEIRDRGIFAGNLTLGPQLLLSPWP